MKIRPLLAAALLGLAVLTAHAPATFAQAKGEMGVRVAPDGPVHEAFAQPARLSTTPPRLVDKAPPKMLDEQIPDEKPDLDGVQWIAGYWGYSPAEKDYVWVSGVWRVPPPDRQWLSGYWNENKGKWQRVRGYWSKYDPAAAEQEVSYLPAPPAPQVETPGSPPEPGSVYSPGSWGWNKASNGYAWQPGSWVAPQSGWSWTAPSYNWTPGGYAASGGYWDYSYGRRGVAFAPVYVPAALRTAGYSYLPTQAVPPAVFENFRTGGSSFRYNNARFVNYRSASWFKRVSIDSATRSEFANLSRELRRTRNLRRQLERKIAGTRKTAHRAALAFPKPRPHKRVKVPDHPRNHRLAENRGPKSNPATRGTNNKRKPANRITGKPGVKKSANKAGARGKSQVKKQGGNKSKAKQIKKKPKKKAGKGKKRPKKKAGKGKKKPKKKAGKGKKKPKKKAGKGKKKPKKKSKKKKPKKKGGKKGKKK